MTVKEVETMLNISRANIRFYENEGLLFPERKSNRYREYSEEDISRLQKIIVLRKLGLGIDEIRQILNTRICRVRWRYVNI